MSRGSGLRIFTAGLAVATILLLGTTAVAQPLAPPPPAPPPPAPAPYPDPDSFDPPHVHEGMYLRLFLGIGYTHMATSDGSTDLAAKGSGFAYGLALRTTVAPNLIVYGELFSDLAFGPTVEQNGQSSNFYQDQRAGAVGIGAGLAYYLESNLYFSGTLAMARLTIEENRAEIARTDYGPGASLMVGKEWWVSHEWGFGLAGQFFSGTMEDQGDNSPTWTTIAFSLALSATFN